MKYLRSLMTITALSIGSYVLYDNSARVINWLLPPPVITAPVEAIEPVEEAVTTTEAEPELKLQGEVIKTVAQTKISVTSQAPSIKVSASTPVSATQAQPAPDLRPVPDVSSVVPPVDVVADQKTTHQLHPVSTSEPSKSSAVPESDVAAVIAATDPSSRTEVPVTQVPVVAPIKKSTPIAKAATAEKNSEIQLIIHNIQFSGVTVFPVEELRKVVGEFVGKELNVDQAFAIPAKITQHYKRHNRMAIATLVGAISPDGVLTVGVVEMPMSPSSAEKELATLTPKAEPQPLASAPLPAKVDAESETDFILKNYAKKSRQYELIADNFGHESTGSARFGGAVTFIDEKVTLTGLKSQGSDYLGFAARWATGVAGMDVGVNISKLNYQVVQHIESAIYRSGDAAKKGVELIYQLVNEPGSTSSLGLSYDEKSMDSTGVSLSDSTSITSHVNSLKWSGVLRELMPGGAVLSYNASYSHGQVDNAGASVVGGFDVPDGAFSKLRFAGTLLQPLSSWGSVLGRLTFQRSDKNLDPSERLYLGGPLGVRAYGVGDGVGSEGHLVSLEFRQRLAAGTTLSEFYDWGKTRQADDPRSTSLKGFGLSLSQDMGNGVTLKGTWARAAGQFPEPNMPQDGSNQYDRNRFWLSMETRF